MDGDGAALGVMQSFAGQHWRMRSGDFRLTAALAQRTGFPELACRLLASRGIEPDDVDTFLNPTLRTGRPDPSTMTEMDLAASRIAAAIAAGEQIAVFADYDVDGATSAALAMRYLAAVGHPAPILHVPDRTRDGYGLNGGALAALQAAGATLVIAVDCGTTAFEALEAAREIGLEVVVLDHHTVEARLPPAVAIVNPNRADDTSGLGQLAACGVTFLTLVAVNRVLRSAGRFGNRSEPDLIDLLDLVAFGTICDVVPLTGVNRVLVSQGLKVLGRQRNAGLKALAATARISASISATDAAFLLGPRVNAGGRIGRADVGARLLATEDPVEAADLAALLDGHNEDRKAIEADVQRQAVAAVEAHGADGGGHDPVILVADEEWHPGVVGIVAGRLRERFHRPACVVAVADGEGKGSGRSVPGFDLGQAILAARRAGLLLKGGGHPMAAGFTVAADRLDELRAFLREWAEGAMASLPPPVLELDGALALGGATPDLVRLVGRLGPFGAGNAEPVFALHGVQAINPRLVGRNHVSCLLTGPEGGRLKAIAFRAADTPLGQALLASGRAPLHLAGTLSLDSWGGRERVQLIIADGAHAWGGGADDWSNGGRAWSDGAAPRPENAPETRIDPPC